MIEDMFSVMQRINQLKKRFGLIRDPAQKTPKINFDRETSRRLDEFSAKGTQIPVKKQSEIKKISVPEINGLVKNHAVRAGIPSSLVQAVIQTESNYNQFAVSKKGALGLMQIMPGMAQKLGVRNPFVAEENIKGGVSFLRQLLEKYNWDYKKALAAYNAGEGAVDKNDGVPPYKETTEYVKKVINTYLKNK